MCSECWCYLLCQPRHPLLLLSTAEGAVRKEGRGRKRSPAKKGQKVAGGRGGRGPHQDTGLQRPLSLVQDAPPRLLPHDCVLVDTDNFKCILYGPAARDTPGRALFLLNPDLVVVDPYEEARGIGERLPRALDAHTHGHTHAHTHATCHPLGSALGCLPFHGPREVGAVGSCGLWPSQSSQDETVGKVNPEVRYAAPFPEPETPHPPQPECLIPVVLLF